MYLIFQWFSWFKDNPVGGGALCTQQSFMQGRSQPPEVQPLTFMYRKDALFVYFFFAEWYPFHVPRLGRFIPFNCCKSTVLIPTPLIHFNW